MSEPALLVERDGGVVTLTLNRPEARNAFNPEMLCGLAAVEGYCYAGGMEMLMSADIRVAGEGARIAISEVCRGLFPMAGTTVRLPRQIPYTVAMEMLLTGAPLDAAEALRVGLLGHVVKDGGALAKARELADAIAKNGPLAVRNIKASVLESSCLPEEKAFVRELELGMEVMSSEDAREGPRAFLEKRPARFKGS